jgi:hypothetical protein
MKRLAVLTAALALGLSGTAFAGPQVVLPGTNDAPGSSDCQTNGVNTPPGANGLCK